MPSQVQNGSLTALEVRQQVERILQSPEFSGSEVVRNLLTFLTRHSIDRPNEAVKEYELGVAVLGKAEGFDPRLDSAVRVHTARLRAKLAEYYMSHGSEDQILIEVPKGSYHLCWRSRAVEVNPHPVQTSPNEDPIQARSLNVRWFAAGFAAAALLAMVSFLLLPPRTQRPAEPVRAFWQTFLDSPQPPIIIFSNHRFVGSSATGLHYFREGIDSPGEANDTYSGTGTVMAIGELSGMLSPAGRAPRLKRAELTTWDEARDANLVFVGAPEANSRLRELAPLQYFAFKSSYEEPRFGTGAIVKLHPGQGEESLYFGSARPFTSDYFVVALLPNQRPEHKVVILAGTNTYGCQAATEVVLRGDLLQEVRERLGALRGPLPDFEALFSVNVSGGVPVHPRLLEVHRRKHAAS